jgi:diamine N-acetyltransferase
MSVAAPILNLVGERVALGPMRRELLPLDQRWINDLRTQGLLGHMPTPHTLEGQQAWFDSLAHASSSVLFLVYAIDAEPARPIGTTGLHDIDQRNGTAEFGILLGEAAARGRGYGTEATRLILDFAFTALGLRNVALRVFAYNPAGLRVYQKVGFREMGRRRESQLFGGRRWDTIYMQALASEFTSPALARVLTPDESR